MNAQLNTLTDVPPVIFRTTADCTGDADKQSHIMLAIKLFSFPTVKNSF